MFRPFLFLLLFTSGASAGSAALTLDSAPRFALAHNPNLAAARLRIDEARGRSRTAGRLANPEIEVELTRNPRAPEGLVSVGFVQKFPLTARLRLEKAISRAELAAAEAEVRDAERKLVAEVRASVVKTLASRGQRALREKQLGNSRELAGFTRQRLETGEASSVDVAQVELESQQLQAELLQLDLERAALLGELRPLLGLAADEDVSVAGELPPLTSLPARGSDPARRPDFQAAQHLAESARQGAALARTQRWDDLSVGLRVDEERVEDAPEGFRRDTFIGLKFSLALPFWNNRAGEIEAAAATARRAEKESEALAKTISAEAAVARESVEALAKVVTALDGQLLPKAAQIEAQLRDSYAAGQTSLQEVLRARDRRLALARQRLDALRDYHLARIRHAAASGPATAFKP